MTLAIHQGTTKNCVVLKVHAGGMLKTAAFAFLRAGGVLKEFFGQLVVTLSRTNVSGTVNSSSAVTVYTGTVSVTVSGAIGALSYVWSRTSPDSQPWSINTPNAVSTQFSTSCTPGDIFNATFICTVTDGGGRVVASGTVTARAANNYFSGAGRYL